MGIKMEAKKQCEYCGENPANMKIDNPNVDEWEKQMEWDVCPTCAKVIPLQQEMSMMHILVSSSERHGLDGGKPAARLKAIEKDLAEISREADMPIISVKIERKK